MRKNTTTCLTILFCAYISLSIVGLPFLYAEAPKIIKLATIAPEGSTWTNVIHDIDKEIDKKSKGRIRLKIYGGGSMGDEKSLIRKMRVSKIDCAAFTSIGLASILPEMRIFDLPFVYKNIEEIAVIKRELYDKFYNAFEKKGYVLLGWSELGFISFFSKKEIKTLSDLQSTNMWLWEGDPLAKALFSFLGITPISLPLPNVTNAIEAGVIDTLYGSPLAIIALNWFKHIKYMLDVPLANATGAILMTKNYYSTLPADLQLILKDSFEINMVRLSRLIQEDNISSKEVMVANGIKLIPGDDTIIKDFENASIKASDKLIGKLYSSELLEVVKEKLEKCRKSNPF